MLLGWDERYELVGRFGPLEILRNSRIDHITAKEVSAPKRLQDLEDLHDLQPTAEEIEFVDQNLDRLEHEPLDEERDILQSLVAET